MKRILYSQNESTIKDDYFVIDGITELNNTSDLSMQAFQMIRSTDDWKIKYKDEDLEIRKKDNFLSIKSHYINKDELDRYLFYIYYIETNDLKQMIDSLKEDSIKINKEVGFETEKLISKINKNRSLQKIIIGVIVTIVISYMLWKTVK